jgi:hypothetical protein
MPRSALTPGRSRIPSRSVNTVSPNAAAAPSARRPAAPPVGASGASQPAEPKANLRPARTPRLKPTSPMALMGAYAATATERLPIRAKPPPNVVASAALVRNHRRGERFCEAGSRAAS